MKAKAFTHDTAANNQALSVDWYTPPWIFEKMGMPFDLDPCAPTGGVSWIPATRWIDKKRDGLKSDWGMSESVWLNPPYGRETKLWLEKMHRHRYGVALVFARTDCSWYHNYAAKADAILFLSGRVKFVDGLGKSSGNGAGSGSMLIAWGYEYAKALGAMSALGDFWDKRGNYETRP